MLAPAELITDNETKNIVDKYFIPSLKRGNYFEGTLIGLKNLIDLLNSKIEPQNKH